MDDLFVPSEPVERPRITTAVQSHADAAGMVDDDGEEQGLAQVWTSCGESDPIYRAYLLECFFYKYRAYLC